MKNINSVTKQLKYKLKKRKKNAANLHDIIAKQTAVLKFLSNKLETIYSKVTRASHSEHDLPKWARNSISDIKTMYDVVMKENLLTDLEHKKTNKIYDKSQYYIPAYKWIIKDRNIIQEDEPIIHIATNNADKYDVFKELFEEAGISIKAQWDVLNAKPVKEDGCSYLENASKKAVYLSELTKGWVIADDSGLEVDALNGLPGVCSSRFAGNKATDKANINKLLEKLNNVYTYPLNATYKCTLAVAFNGQIVNTFTGTLPGTITRDPRGSNGWSYDSIFIPEGFFSSTLAELSKETQKQISHRYIAFMRFISWFKQLSW